MKIRISIIFSAISILLTACDFYYPKTEYLILDFNYSKQDRFIPSIIIDFNDKIMFIKNSGFESSTHAPPQSTQVNNHQQARDSITEEVLALTTAEIIAIDQVLQSFSQEEYELKEGDLIFDGAATRITQFTTDRKLNVTLLVNNSTVKYQKLICLIYLTILGKNSKNLTYFKSCSAKIRQPICN